MLPPPGLLFPVATIGSWPRPPELLRALRAHRRGRMGAAEFAAIADAAVLAALRDQEEAGVDFVTDGEQHRDSFYSFVATRLDGVAALSLADLLAHVEDKASFEALLRAMGVPAFAIFNPTVVGRVTRRESLLAGDFAFLARHSNTPIKVTLPGPYMLLRTLWVEGLSRRAYATREQLADDLVALLREELAALRLAGATFVQFDEPVLTELVFSSGQSKRAFLCASLSTRDDPSAELDFAVSLINRVVAGMDGMYFAVHVCRGNWSNDEAVLPGGAYDPLLPYLEKMNVAQLALEYATPRAGGLASLRGVSKQIGLGVVNPRTPDVEAPAAIADRVREALRYLPAAQIWLNPDCGFGAYAVAQVNTRAIAARKLASVVAAAVLLRREYGAG